MECGGGDLAGRPIGAYCEWKDRECLSPCCSSPIRKTPEVHSLNPGKIAIEIEFAEIWFRRIEVKALG